MEWLDVLCQPPVLLALVPHLDRVDARALFSCARRLHLALKGSTELRAAVWTLGNCNAQGSLVKVSPLLKSIAKHGDLGAMKFFCERMRNLYDTEQPSSRLFKQSWYWRPLRSALFEAICAKQHHIEQFLITGGFAQVTCEMMVDAIHDGHLHMVMHFDAHHPTIALNISSKMYSTEGELDSEGPLDAANFMEVLVSGLEVRGVTIITDMHRKIHRYLSS
jgi:hypothetical protein